MDCAALALIAVLALAVDALWRRALRAERGRALDAAQRAERDVEAWRAGYEQGYRDATRQRPSGSHDTDSPRRAR